MKQKILVWPGLTQESSIRTAEGMRDREVHMDLASGKAPGPSLQGSSWHWDSKVNPGSEALAVWHSHGWVTILKAGS